jgi:rare lipoprotein A
VTKRRPSWSDRLRRAVALAGGVLLCLALPAAAAAPDGAKKAPAVKKTKKAGKPELPVAEIGVAELAESEALGLHGSASFYGAGFHGRRTATGEIFDARGFTAASNRYALGTWVAVQRLDNDRCAVVKINDRMHPRHRKRIIDVSRGVAEHLGMVRAGVVLVRTIPLSGKPKDSRVCPAAPEADLPLQESGEPVREWRDPPVEVQRDAMQ